MQIFENSPNKNAKDPALLSIGERKALFEKNQGAALLPKAPFGMAIPVSKIKPNIQELGSKQTTTKPVIKTVVAKIETPVLHHTPPESSGIASKVAALLGNKNTISQQQIESSTKLERQKDMDILLNRHKKNIQVILIYFTQLPLIAMLFIYSLHMKK